MKQKKMPRKELVSPGLVVKMIKILRRQSSSARRKKSCDDGNSKTRMLLLYSTIHLLQVSLSRLVTIRGISNSLPWIGLATRFNNNHKAQAT